MASAINPYVTQHAIYRDYHPRYRFKKFKVFAGDVIEGSGGVNDNIDILSLVDENENYIECIAQGGCDCYKHIVIQDCYVVFSTDITNNTFGNLIKIYRADYKDVFWHTGKNTHVAKYGWKLGYIDVDGNYWYDPNYIVSNQIIVNAFEYIEIKSYIKTGVAAIQIIDSNGLSHTVEGKNDTILTTYAITNGYTNAILKFSRKLASTANISIASFGDNKLIYDNAVQENESITSLTDFIKPWFGGVFNTAIEDKPNDKSGNLIVIPHNIQYVLQIYYIYSAKITLKRLVNMQTKQPYSDWTAQGVPLFGKTIIGIGDSLMRGNYLSVDDTWLNLLEANYLTHSYNYGINGNTVAVQTAETANSPMVNRIQQIYNEHNNIDYFVLIGGANDRRLNVPLGNDDSANKSEFCGAINSIIDQVRQYWPKAHVLFLTNYDRNPETANSLGLYDIDYVEAMKRACAKKHVYCFDNYHDSGVAFADSHFSAWADEGIYRGGAANKHFSPEGYKWLMPKYKALLEMI